MQNRLRPKQNPPIKRPMTAIAALICKDGIVIAADSETTELDTVRRDAEKISTLQMDGAMTLVAESGNAESSRGVIEILSRLAKGAKLDDYQKVADLGGQALLAYKRELGGKCYHCKMEKLNSLLKNV